MRNCLLLIPLLFIMFGARAQMTPDEQRAMKAYAQPGAMQDRLTRHFGEWEEKIYLWKTPESTPDSIRTIVDYEMILEKRFLRMTHVGKLNGTPWEAISTTGYDNVREVYMNTWMDYSGTAIIYSEGKWNDAIKTIEFKGQMTDPITKKQVPYRMNWVFEDPMTQRIEVFHRYKGKEFRAMLILLQRE